jgi:hypothetical protein
VGEKRQMSGNTMLLLGLGVCAALVVVALVGSRFLKTPPPPPPPAPPPAPEASVTTMLRYTTGYFRALLEEDAKRFGVAPVSEEKLAQPLTYADELPSSKTMKPERDTLETAHLKLTTRVVKEWSTTPAGEGFRSEHIVLGITNRSDRPLAYRVETAVSHPERCKSKGALVHNAMALKPGETLARTECLWQPHATLTIKHVEVIELPTDLSYYYVSRLNPGQVLVDERTSSGHEPAGKAKVCGFIPWREIRAGAEAATTRWVDVIDFYARHNCDEYSFYPEYHRWSTPGSLPAHATKGASPEPAPAKPVDRTHETH